MILVLALLNLFLGSQSGTVTGPVVRSYCGPEAKFWSELYHRRMVPVAETGKGAPARALVVFDDDQGDLGFTAH
jgi:hypothetical protein